MDKRNSMRDTQPDNTTSFVQATCGSFSVVIYAFTYLLIWSQVQPTEATSTHSRLCTTTMLTMLRLVFLLLLSVSVLPPSRGLRWHRGCMCELPSDGNQGTDDAAQQNQTPSFATSAIFDSTHFRLDGELAQFCPCSLETIQTLNHEIIAPALNDVLSTHFFRYFRVDLDAECAFWDADGYCTIKDCSVDEEDQEREAYLSNIDLSYDATHDPETFRQSFPNDVDNSWTNEDENSEFHYIDLHRNPERFTGYRCEVCRCDDTVTVFFPACNNV